MRVVAIISRDVQKGSTRYRLGQYVEPLAARGVEVAFVSKNALGAAAMTRIREADLVFNQKCLLSGWMARRVMRHGRRILFDFDDAIYTRPGRPYRALTAFRVRRRLMTWLREADVVTTSSRYLARLAQTQARRVEVVPMALDPDLWKPRDARPREQVVIGWIGSPATVRFIEDLDSVLGRLLRRFSHVKLACFCGQRPRLSCAMDYHPFSPDREPGFVRHLDIGLLPLPDEPYTRGKSPLKALQYLACGVPVIGNVIGAGREILGPANSLAVSSPAEWLEGLEWLVTHGEQRQAMGREGRAQVLRNHDRNAVFERLYRIVRGDQGNGLQGEPTAENVESAEGGMDKGATGPGER